MVVLFFLNLFRCFLNFLSSHVVLLHHETSSETFLRLLLLYVESLVNGGPRGSASTSFTALL